MDPRRGGVPFGAGGEGGRRGGGGRMTGAASAAGGGGGGGGGRGATTPAVRFPSPTPASTSSSRPDSAAHSPPSGSRTPLLVLPSLHSSSSRPPTAAAATPVAAMSPSSPAPPPLGTTTAASSSPSPAAPANSTTSTAATAAAIDDAAGLDLALTLKHDHKDLVQVVAFNMYGDRCATGSVDGKIRVFNRSKDDVWRVCDKWGAHGGEVLELQWLPATVYPNLIASLGIEGKFKLWAEDPSAAPGKRFHNGGSRTADGKPAYETRSSSPRSPYRSFSMRHSDDTRTTHLALLATDGRMSVFESDEPERIAECASIDDFSVISPAGRRPARGEEVSFKVRFDPNPEPCYSALRAGVVQDSLAMVVASMDTVKIFRSRDVEVPTSYGGPPQVVRRFYCVAEVAGHRGLVRDVAWAFGNIRGYDLVASACADGLVRVLRIETPVDDPTKGWTVAELTKRDTAASSPPLNNNTHNTTRSRSSRDSRHTQPQPQQDHHGQSALHSLQHQMSSLSVSLARTSSGTGAANDRSDQPPGGVAHVATEISRLDCHGAPVWRVAFNDDGQILGSAGDDGRLMLYRQRPDETWAKSSELGLMKAHMAVPLMASSE